MTPEFVTLGGITLDWVIGSNGDINIKGCGGNALYSAVGAYFWSEDVAVVSTVGRNYPPAHLAAFERAGIRTAGICRLAEPHELVAAYQYDANGERRDLIPSKDLAALGVSAPEGLEEHPLFHPDSWAAELRAHFDPRLDEMPASYWGARGFHLANMSFPVQKHSAERLAALNRLFSLDTNNPASTKSERQALLSIVPVFLPSQAQLELVLDSIPDNLKDALVQLARMGPRAVVIKIGRHGSLVYDANRDKHYHVPVYPTRAVDPTGAGDAFCGGFLVGYAQTGDAFEAALRGTVSSSFVVEGFDARYGLRFQRRDAERRLERLRRRLVDAPQYPSIS